MIVLGGSILVCVTIVVCSVLIGDQVQELQGEVRSTIRAIESLQQDNALRNQWQLDELPAIHGTLKAGLIALLATRKNSEVQISDASDVRIKEARDSFSSVKVSNFLAEEEESSNSETQHGAASQEGAKN